MAPTEVLTATTSLVTDCPEQGHLLRKYRKKFAILPDDIQTIKTCSDAGFMKTVWAGHYFTTIHEVEMARLGCTGSCRENTLRDNPTTIPKGWILGCTKIGPVLEVAVSSHLGRYGIKMKIVSMQNDGSKSWVVISRGMNKYVTDMPQAEEQVDTNPPSSTPAQNSASSSSSMRAAIPVNEMQWITVPVVNPDDCDYDSHACWIPKTMCKILRQSPSSRS